MIISAHMNFFRINKCGLYKTGGDVAKGLEPSETFSLIYDWVKTRPMEATIPWDPVSAKSGMAKCYCHDFFHCEETGDFLFVLWKSESDSTGAIWGAQANAPTGMSSVVEYKDNYKGRKVIWGRPCYYWIVPELNTIVSIKVDHSVCDSGLFQEWVSKSITNRVNHPDKTKTETDNGFVRFEFSDSTENTGRYSYRFDVHLRSLETGNAEMDELVSTVTHIVRRDTIKVGTGVDERPAWVKLFDSVPFLPPKPKAKTRQIEVRAEAKPSAAEIKAIVESFAREERGKNSWNNVGFQTENGTVVWADRYRLHSKINLSKDASTVFAASDLFSQLNKQRDRILRAVRKDESSRMGAEKKTALGVGS
ncbi:hypothetical protein [Methyloversatilis sp. NSM2]|uniref:hypothetical protein n=1 Tax=Methyloversatilis sp. NSM2 TaxID=3134135 RepID=UPI003118C5FF